MSGETDIRVRDPVCGKKLDLADAAAMVDHGGWAHFFCSEARRDAFLANPGRFAAGSARPFQKASGQYG